MVVLYGLSGFWPDAGEAKQTYFLDEASDAAMVQRLAAIEVMMLRVRYEQPFQVDHANGNSAARFIWLS
jgi:hypothetical protein